MAAESNIFDIETLSIAELRKMASSLKIESQKDWDKSMYINAINTRRKQRKVCRIVDDPNSGDIPQGFARIRLHLTPSGQDWPVDVMVNNFKTSITRNIWVDVPREVRDALRNSTELVPKVVTNTEGKQAVSMQAVPCYPFDQIGETPGESYAIRPSGDVKVQRLREKYREAYGRWPKREQEREFMKRFIDAYEDKKIKGIVENDEV